MAPPRKRRRLSLFDPPSSPSSDENAVSEPLASYPHSVTDLVSNAKLSGPRSVPKRIEEIHLQIQQQGAGAERNPPQRRQVINSIVSALDSLTSSTPASSVASTSTTSTGETIPSSSSTQTPSSSSAFPSLSVGASRNSTAVHTTHSTILPTTYLVTLTNSNVKTITRSPQPYVTTFGDGQVSTICDRHGDCKMGKSTTSKSTPSTPFLSQAPSTSSAAAVVVASSTPTTSNPASSSMSSTTQHHDSNTSAPPPATIAGGAVGGIAGVAVLILLALIFVRMYKRKAQNGHYALPASDGMASGGHSGMIDRAGFASLANVLPPLFRHQNKSQDTPASTERGFTKVSGRKLPSVWSEGMTREDLVRSPPPNMPLKDNQSTPNLLDRDSTGFYNSDAQYFERGTGSISPDPSPFADQGTSPVSMTLSPGPQRTPKFVHEPSPYVMPSSQRASVPLERQYANARPHSPPAQPQERSPSPSTVGDRSSKFMEDV